MAPARRAGGAKCPLSRSRRRARASPIRRKCSIEIGAPGQDHDAIEWTREIATFASIPAKAASDAPRVAEVIGLISEHLKG